MELKARGKTKEREPKTTYERRGRKEESNTTGQEGGFGNKGHLGDRTGGQASPPK